MRGRFAVLTAFLATVAAGCSDDGTGLDVVDLEGTWLATVYEYTDNANAENVVDVIQRDGASFTMTVDAAGTASTIFDDGVGGTSSDSGTLNAEGDLLTLAGDPFTAQRSGDTLTLEYADDSFDFGEGSVPATLRIVMTR